MQRYEFRDLKRYASAEEVAVWLGIKVKDHRSAAAWRGGEGQNVSYKDGLFHDFANKNGSPEHGDGVDLYMLMTNTSQEEAVNAIGDHFCPSLERKERKTAHRKAKASEPKASAAKPKYELPPPPADPPPPPPSPAPIMTQPEAQEPPQEPPKELSVLPPAATGHLESLLHNGWQETMRWAYRNRFGDVAFWKVRLDKPGTNDKEFVQLGPDGSSGLVGVEPILYNLPLVIKAHTVCVVEGEKCAETLQMRLPDGCAATTANNGAKRWKASYNSDLAGRSVVVVADNDEAGLEHARIVANSVFEVTQNIKVVVPSDKPKGDIADYFELGRHDIADFMRLVEEAELFTPDLPGTVTEEMRRAAKAANATSFSNYTVGNDGKPVPRPYSEVMEDFAMRFMGYPKRLGLTLFDKDQHTGDIVPLSNTTDLFGWITRISMHNIRWRSGEGYLTKDDLFAAVYQSARRFEAFSKTYTYPISSSVFYDCPKMPKVNGTTHFDELVSRFNPSTEYDRLMIKTLFMAPMWWPRGNARPLFIIDSDSGVAVGKTSLVDMVCRLYNCPPIRASQRDFDKNDATLMGRILSTEGKKAKVLLIDNVNGVLSSSNFANLITAETISGHVPYSRGEDTRPNDLIYVVTTNGGQVNEDMRSRAYNIVLTRPSGDVSDWRASTGAFIDAHRHEILAEGYNAMANNAHRWPTHTRFPDFEHEVVQAFVDTEEEYRALFDYNAQINANNNYERELAETFIDMFRSKLIDFRLNPDDNCLFIPGNIVSSISKSISEGKPKTIAQIRAMGTLGLTRSIDGKILQFPNPGFGHGGRRGIMWRSEKREDGQKVVFLMFNANGQIAGIDNYEGKEWQYDNRDN